MRDAAPPVMHWSRWGDPALAESLPSAAQDMVEAAFGLAARPSAAIEDVRLPEPALPADLVAELIVLLGAEHVLLDRDARIRHTRGKSTPDLLRIRAGDGGDAPDAVLRPGHHDDVQAVVDWCSRHRVALVPFGGGTSVVGGLAVGDLAVGDSAGGDSAGPRDGYAGVVALDLCRLDQLLDLDVESRTATLGAGLLGPAAEALLGAHQLTIGHFPQSFEYATIGGFAATRSSGQASSGYGRFDDLVVGLSVATPRGTLELGRAPASAAGPDLRELVLGSEGAFGVITSVTVRVRPVPPVTVHEAWRFASFAEGVQALRALAQSGTAPTVLRLSDESETAINLAQPADVGGQPTGSEGGCLMITGYEGEPDTVDTTRAATAAVLHRLGGESLGEPAGEAWAQGRFHGPYLRDSLLDVGVLVETLETATFWSGLATLYDGVRGALHDSLSSQGTDPIVLCHISHVYETGASLYFTVAAKQLDDPLAQWHQAKVAASEAIVAAGATITHHHAIGRDHKPWLAEEIGPVGVDMLRAVKAGLDPAGVLNPGVLIP